MKVGFIGFGNMASAMVYGMVNSKRYSEEMFYLTSYNFDKLTEKLKGRKFNLTSENIKVAEVCDVIFLTVKPYLYKDVLNQIKEYLTEDKIIVTVAPGISTLDIENIIGEKTKVIRTMPNTPAQVMAGMTAYCINKNITEEDKRKVSLMLQSFGMAEEINENQMDAVVPLTGSSPAYIFMLIEAMADEAVLEGIERDKAYRLAAQAVLGSAKMVLDTGYHPGKLKDMVCSPKGTTIEAVRSLEKTGFRSSVIEAMKACSDKIKK